MQPFISTMALSFLLADYAVSEHKVAKAYMQFQADLSVSQEANTFFWIISPNNYTFTCVSHYKSAPSPTHKFTKCKIDAS